MGLGRLARGLSCKEKRIRCVVFGKHNFLQNLLRINALATDVMIFSTRFTISRIVVLRFLIGRGTFRDDRLINDYIIIKY